MNKKSLFIVLLLLNVAYEASSVSAKLSCDEKQNRSGFFIQATSIERSAMRQQLQHVLDVNFAPLKRQALDRFASYDVHAWRQYLASCDPTGRALSIDQWSQQARNEVFLYFNLYQFPAFREYIAQQHGYDEMIIAIHERIKNDVDFAHKLTHMRICKHQSVKDFICNEASASTQKLTQRSKQQLASPLVVLQQQQKRHVVETMERQQEDLEDIVGAADFINEPKNRYEQYVVDRAQAIKQTAHECSAMSTQHYTILAPGDALLQSVGLNKDDFTHCYGNAIQQVIHKELVTSLNRAGMLHGQVQHNAEIKHLAQSTAEFASIGIAFNKAGHITKAVELSNLTRAFVEYNMAILQGIGDGVVNTGHMVLHPIDTTANILRTAGTAAYYLSKVLHEIIKIDFYLEADPAFARETIAMHAKNIEIMHHAITEKYNASSGPEMVRGATGMATEAFLTGKLLGAAHKFYGNARGKIGDFINGADKGLATAEKLIASAEGLEVRIASEAVDAIKMARAGTADATNVRWGFWNDLPKAAHNGRTYAKIGDHLYTRHAIDRMGVTSLGIPAGGWEPRGIPTFLVEHVIKNGAIVETRTTNGIKRITKMCDNIHVVMENNIVVTLYYQS